jgi:hypothetical protein
MERYCSTGQSPQRAVTPTEEEGEKSMSSLALYFRVNMWYRKSLLQCKLLASLWDWLSNLLAVSFLAFKDDYYRELFLKINS